VQETLSMFWFNSERWRSFHVGFARVRVLIVLLGLAPYLYFATARPLWPAAVVVALGELLQLWAAANLHKNEDLARRGPYAWVRNPMYVGRFIVGIGLSLALSLWWIALPVFAVVYAVYVHARVLREEDRLVEYLGDPYLDYCRQVGRWFPRRLPRLSEFASWSWSGVARNRQWRISLALIAVFALILVRRHYL
jgi:protein-S-isoprenylcysteine O-methyltransferase Ste14